jgi:predicted NAD/FAD-dependent oxidoreductase
MMAAAPTSTSNMLSCHCRVAIIGGGIAGATVATTLAARLKENPSSRRVNVDIHVFDQGRSGVGGRTSHRVISQNDDDDKSTMTLQWDHGCQFFRADTPQFQTILKKWIDQKHIAAPWQGTFRGESGAADFFGLPSCPPFYVGVGGIRSIAQHLLHETSDCIQVFEGHRVTGMTRDETSASSSTNGSSGSGSRKTWSLFGTNGEPAYHDSAETVAQSAASDLIGDDYDVVVLTDISSSFSSWHRASAGVPQDFADRVRARAGSRVPLFTCMIAFDTPVPVSISAATLNDPTLWFVARSNEKPGLEHLSRDCWTLVSTPEYAIQAIAETPMQDQVTGEFLPQDPDYLRQVPAAELEAAFRRIVQEGRLGGIDSDSNSISGGGECGGGGADETRSVLDMPQTCYVTAQRWGSALPAHRHLSESSPTRSVISGVAYDSGRGTLAPTQLVYDTDQNSSYVADEELMIFQAGDMVSSYTPGFEGAVLSGMDAAHRIAELLTMSYEATTRGSDDK